MLVPSRVAVMPAGKAPITSSSPLRASVRVTVTRFSGLASDSDTADPSVAVPPAFSVGLVPPVETVGAWVSTVRLSVPDRPMVPALSVAVVTTLWAPSVSGVVTAKLQRLGSAQKLYREHRSHMVHDGSRLQRRRHSHGHVILPPRARRNRIHAGGM